MKKMKKKRMKKLFGMLLNYLYLHSNSDRDFIDTLVYLGFEEYEIANLVDDIIF